MNYNEINQKYNAVPQYIRILGYMMVKSYMKIKKDEDGQKLTDNSLVNAVTFELLRVLHDEPSEDKNSLPEKFRTLCMIRYGRLIMVNHIDNLGTGYIEFEMLIATLARARIQVTNPVISCADYFYSHKAFELLTDYSEHIVDNHPDFIEYKKEYRETEAEFKSAGEDDKEVKCLTEWIMKFCLHPTKHFDFPIDDKDEIGDRQHYKRYMAVPYMRSMACDDEEEEDE